MGLVDQPVVPWTFVGKDITIRGKVMYERNDIVLLIEMLEGGLFPRGKQGTSSFALYYFLA
jgi:hypothetical protein